MTETKLLIVERCSDRLDACSLSRSGRQVVRTTRSRVKRVVGQDRGWVAGQLVLLALIALSGCIERSRRNRSRDDRLSAFAAGVTATGCTALSAGVALRAKIDLADSFTMSPSPLADGDLVRTGVYATIRHPMYLSVLLLIMGYGLVTGMRTLLFGFGASALFFVAKIRHEERALERRYPAYAGYREQVRWRFIPGIW